MTLTTVTITGRCPLPDDSAPAKASIEFALSGFDTEGANVTLPDVIQHDLTSGDLPADVTLWANTEGLRGTYYKVTVTTKDTATGREVAERLGNIQIAATPATQALADLLNTPVPDAPEWKTSLDDAIDVTKRNPSPTQRGAPLKSTSAENAVGTVQDKYPDVAGVREMIAEHANGAVNVVSLTAAEYAAITDPDVNTIYLVTS